jgi:PadR family transcriptional regulator PadR
VSRTRTLPGNERTLHSRRPASHAANHFQIQSSNPYIEVDILCFGGRSMGERVTCDSLGEFEQSLLLAIVHLGPTAYGVTIQREIESRTGREVAVGALYTSLGRLERKGYVRSALADPTPERGGRSKRFFTLRPAGVAALRQSRERLARMWHGLAPDLRKVRS